MPGPSVHESPGPFGWTPGMIRLQAVVVLIAAAAVAAFRPRATTAVPPAPVLRVDANTAPLYVLEALPQVGPVLAGAIDEARREAPFRSIDDFDRRVRGIGPSKRAALEPFLTFGDGTDSE